DGAGAAADLALKSLVGAVQLAPALRPPRVLLTVRAAVARMLAHPGADLRELLGAGLLRGGVAGGNAHALEVGELAPQRGVLAEVADLAHHRLLVAGQGGLLPLRLAGEVDDGAVRLELRERQFQDPARLGSPETFDEVHGHV